MHARRVALITAFAVLPLATGGAAAAGSVAFTPAREEIIEPQLLPPSAKRAVQALAKAASSTTPQASGREQIAAARRLIEAGRQSGDPRTLGYAEQVLLAIRPSSSTAEAIDVLVLQATIEQSRHRFDEATRLLDNALERDPGHPQARLTRATVAQVGGRHEAARADCGRLAGDVANICSASVDGLVGKNERAVATLERVAARADAATRSWALSVSGDIHVQSGNLSEAVRRYSRSLALADDLYTRVALADALIDLGRFDSALAILAEAPVTDAVLLRRWRATRGKSPKAAEVEVIARQLAGRISAADLRGENLHVREAAWFALETADAQRALNLARSNWSSQREPADAHLLAVAARAAADQAAAREVRAWIAATGLRDARVDRALLKPGA